MCKTTFPFKKPNYVKIDNYENRIRFYFRVYKLCVLIWRELTYAKKNYRFTNWSHTFSRYLIKLGFTTGNCKTLIQVLFPLFLKCCRIIVPRVLLPQLFTVNCRIHYVHTFFYCSIKSFHLNLAFSTSDFLSLRSSWCILTNIPYCQFLSDV